MTKSVLVTPSGQIKILDFGLAREVDRNSLFLCPTACALRFAGPSHYAHQRLDLSPSSARRLVSIDRDLRHRPKIAAAFLDGLISQSHVELIGRVVLSRTESAWIDYAQEVPVRQLRDDVKREERSPGTGMPPTFKALAATQAPHVSQPEPAAELPHVPQPEPAAELPDVPQTELAGEGPLGKGPCTVASASLVVALSEVAPTCAARLDNFSPLDNPVRRVRLWLPDDMIPLWDDVRHYVASIDGRQRTTFDTLAVVAQMFLGEWDHVGAVEARLHPIQDRDGWRCAVPHCTRRANLEDHHVVFRSHGGDNSEGNRVSLCAGHHRKAIHQGYVILRGEAPDNLYWILGVREDGSAPMIIDGDRIIHVDGFPHVSDSCTASLPPPAVVMTP